MLCLKMLPVVGQHIFVRDEISLAIKHCLVVRRGVTLDQIGAVLSHEQAIGQSSHFLEQHLPGVKVVHTNSTAAAARAILSPHPDNVERAAICSSLCVKLYDGLDVLCEGIQNGPENVTRFFILCDSSSAVLPGSSTKRVVQRALLRLSTQPTCRNTASTLLPLLKSISLSVARIDRRPSLSKHLFHDVYFVELVSEAEIDQRSWTQAVEKDIESIRTTGGQVDLLGVW